MTDQTERLIQKDESLAIELSWIRTLFEVDKVNSGTSTAALTKYGGSHVICQKLETTLKLGIQDTPESRARRIAKFGTNELVEPPAKTLWKIFLGCFEDLTLQILCVAAMVSLIIGISTEGLAKGWIEGAAIMVAVIIVVTITTVNDYTQAQQFRNLFKKSQVKIVKVIRDGTLKEIDTQDLVVGDIYELNTGLIVPADSLLIEKHSEFMVDESAMTGESKHLKKSSDNHPQLDSNPFLISGSQIVDGSGYGLALAVGRNSQLGIMRESMDTETPETPLQLKLEDLGNMIGNLGMLGAGLTVIGCTLGLIIRCISSEEQDLFSMETLREFMDFIILGITIIVMAVPEGLPMAVVISLAYSVEKMRQLNNLVRKMDACETMGNVTDICSDKTGTLTENNMTVIDVFYGNNLLSFASKSFTDKLKQDMDLKDLCVSAAINSTATPVFTRSLKEQLGNKTEMSIIDFCYNLGVDYSKVRTLENIILMIPFSSERKKMMTLFKDEKGTLWLYAKGAPEIILGACTLYRADNKTFRIEKDYRTNLEKNTLGLIASKKARAIASAKVEVSSYKPGDDLEQYFKDMIFLGIFGIMDPIRLDVPPAVAVAQGAGITVRMVTGDNTQIGSAIAKECGIINKDWTVEADPDVVLDGAAFRERIGGLKWKEEQDGDTTKRTPYVGDMHAFTKIEPKLRVIGRCKPDDKLLLVTGLQALGKVVAVTGDGANDAPALNRADVGLGMGKTGTDICKDASKIVLLDDNFASIITAVKFGRNIFDAIRKFMKFQLTVNLTAMAIAITCGFIIKESPINAIQMLWINVIMDSFSALALATEPPTDELLTRPPTKRREPIVTQSLWNAVCFQSSCQFVLLMIVLFLSPGWFEIPSSISMRVKN